MGIAGILWILFRVGRWQPLERIGDKHAAIGDTVRGEYGRHEDAGASPPDACLQQIARHLVLEHALNAALDVIESFLADHRMRVARPERAFLAVRFGST